MHHTNRYSKIYNLYFATIEKPAGESLDVLVEAVLKNPLKTNNFLKLHFLLTKLMFPIIIAI